MRHKLSLNIYVCVCYLGHMLVKIALNSVYMFNIAGDIWIYLTDLSASTSVAGIIFHNNIVHLQSSFNRSVLNGEICLKS